MKRIIWAAAFIALQPKITIQGYPLKETTGQLNHKTIGAETNSTIIDFSRKKQEPPDAYTSKDRKNVLKDEATLGEDITDARLDGFGPSKEVKRVIVLDVEHLLQDIFGDNAFAEHSGGGEVAVVAGVGSAHHALVVKLLEKALQDSQRVVMLGAALSEAGETSQGVHAVVASATERVSDQQTLEAITASGFVSNAVENAIDDFSVNLAPETKFKLKPSEPADEKQAETDLGQFRRLGTPGYCTNSASLLNLFNTAAYAEQSSFSTSNGSSAILGCDGDVIMMLTGDPPASYVWAYTKLVASQVAGTTSVPQYWKVTFPSTRSIKSTVFINRDDQLTTQIQSLAVTFGFNADVKSNPVCVAQGTMTDGGWYMCATSMTGTVFGFYSTTSLFGCMEAMAYSQEAIHLNAGVAYSIIGTTVLSSYYPAINSIQKLIVPIVYDMARQHCVTVNQPSGGFAKLSVKFKAQVQINGVVLIPGYRISETPWPGYQTNVAINGKTVGGTEQLCGVLGNYYTKYGEVLCNIQVNEIILVQQSSSKDLRFCGFGALSDCNCAQSSFDSTQFTTRQATSFASVTSLTVKYTDSLQSITFNNQMADTVSSVCGSADGFSKCPRVIVFKDKTTGQLVTFPYKGMTYDASQSSYSVLTLNPAQAEATCVLTATLQIVGYPTVSYSQDITITTALKPAQLYIQNLYVNAEIGKEALIIISNIIGVQYTIISQPPFQAKVQGNQLQVLSISKSDVGTYLLKMSASDSSSDCLFTVNLIFKQAASTTTSTTSTTKTTTTTAATTKTATAVTTKTTTATAAISTETSTTSKSTTQDSQEKTLNDQTTTETTLTESISSQEAVKNSQQETTKCTTDEEGIITCVGLNGFSFKVDALTGKSVHDDIHSAAALLPKPPTLSVSKVNSGGEFSFKFSEPVGSESLFKPTSSSRRLKVSSSKAKQAAKNIAASNQIDLTQFYLLSPEHLSLTIQSLNTTTPVFSWYAKNITSTEITIQLVFQDPLYISNQPDSLDKLVITLLQPAMQYLNSLKTGEVTEDALKTVIRSLPKQVIIGAAIKSAQAASDGLKNIGQASTLGNVGVQIVLSGSMSQMWSMVNAQQITLSFSLLNLQMPGNVMLVITNLAAICDFNVFPTDVIMAFLFNFTPTDSPGVGFVSMGNDNKSLTLYLGSAFLIMILIGLQYLLYSLAYGCRHYDRLLGWIEQKLRPGLFYGVIYLFLIETYLDWAIGSALRLEEPKFQTPSDCFDFGQACVGILITLVLPCYCFFFLRKNVNQLDEEDFKSKHGSLYEGFITDNAFYRQNSMKVTPWFLLRRFFTAVNLVYLRNFTMWIQLTINMYLSLADVCIKLHLSPYESKVGGFMEKFNDMFVLICAYFPYLFTDLIQSQEDMYYIGWYYIGIITIMLTANIFVMVISAFQDLKEKISTMIKKCKQKKATEEQNRKRKLQKEAMEKVKLDQGKILNGGSFTGMEAMDEREILEQQKALKRLERAKAREIAQQRDRDGGQLEEIKEMDSFAFTSPSSSSIEESSSVSFEQINDQPSNKVVPRVEQEPENLLDQTFGNKKKITAAEERRLRLQNKTQTVFNEDEKRKQQLVEESAVIQEVQNIQRIEEDAIFDQSAIISQWVSQEHKKLEKQQMINWSHAPSAQILSKNPLEAYKQLGEQMDNFDDIVKFVFGEGQHRTGVQNVPKEIKLKQVQQKDEQYFMKDGKIFYGPVLETRSRKN